MLRRSNMPWDFLNFSNYAYNPSAIPPIVAAVMAGWVGLWTSVREHGSSAVAPFVTIVVGVVIWQASGAIMFLSTDASTAKLWAIIGSAGTTLLPASIYFFSAAIAEKVDEVTMRILLGYGAGLLLLIALVLTPSYLEGLHTYSWGYYPQYGVAGLVFALYLMVMFSASLRLLWKARRATKHGSTMRQRIRLVLIAEAIALLAAVDLLPAYGIVVYPFGLLMVLAFLGIIARVTKSYHFIDITPALAGQAIIETISEALIIVNEDGIIRLVNPAALKLLSCGESELLGSTFSDMFKFKGTEHIHEQLLKGETIRGIETAYRTPHGQARTVSISASALPGSGPTPIALIYVLRDITVQKKAEARIRYLAYNDALTQLPNRIQFDQTLRRAMAQKSVNTITTLFVDLDRFKRVNDSLGHDAGDELLLAAANRLKLCLRRENFGENERGASMIARIGGDEFAIALFGVNRIQQIRKVAQRVIDTLAHPFAVQGEEVRIGASLGVSIYPRDGRDPETLLKNADRAMYQAKQAGRSNYHFYNSTMDAISAERVQLEKDMRGALENEEFEVYYQPQVDVRNGRIFGVEALLRWNHPMRGVISPMEFIPLAEDDGSIIAIGRWVLRHACAQLKRWHAANFGHLSMAVNISARQLLRGNLVKDIREALDKVGLNPKHLQIELTESLLMKNADQVIGSLQELKAKGITIAVDDFGTGYSSLSYLKRFPIDVIKIDRSFVRDITTDAEDAAITGAILALANSLRRHTIAEGVETRSQLDMLRAKGCNLMQGYLFGKACTAGHMTTMLEHERILWTGNQNIIDFQSWTTTSEKSEIDGSDTETAER